MVCPTFTLVRFRLAIPLLAAGLATVACSGSSGGSNRSSASRSATTGVGPTSTVGAALSGSGVAGGGQSPRIGGVPVPGQGPGPTTSSALAGGGSAATSSRNPAAEARAAFDAYLRGIVARDAATMLDNSAEIAGALGAVRLTVAAANAARQGTTTVTVTKEDVTVTQITASQVTLSGDVELDSEVSGPAGPPQRSQDHLSGPIVIGNRTGRWRVVDFTYDGAPLVYTPESVSQQDTNGSNPLQLNVAFVLSFARTTGVLVGLAAAHDVNVAFQTTALATTAGSESGGAVATSGTRPTVLLRFARTDARPTRLDASFKRQDGTTDSFSVALPGSPV